jgi:uncharacterized protein (TIGR03382 family)
MTKQAKVLAALTLGFTLLVPQESEACTNPSKNADDPKACPAGSELGCPSSPDGGTGLPPFNENGPGGSGTDAGTNPGGTPGTGSDGGTPPFNETGGGNNPDPNNLGSSELSLTAGDVQIAWKPGYDTDADPNKSAYFSHGDHKVWTRVVVRDATGKFFRDELVPQYEYDGAQKGRAFDATRFLVLKDLAPGQYEVKVQSVFYRHDQVMFGLNGKWRPQSALEDRPAIGSDVKGLRFDVVERNSSNASGCSATGASALLLPALGLLLGLARRRRRA